MQGLEKIASLLKLYKLRVTLYVDKQPNDVSGRNLSFENAVIKVYIHILEFQARVVSHLWKGSLRQVARNTVKADDWRGRLDDIEKADAECLLFTDLLDKKKEDRTREQQYMQSEQQTKVQQGIVEALNTTRKEQEADYIDERRNKLMHSLSTDYEEHKNFNPKRVPGTCEWFLHSKEFLEWCDATDSRILWVSAGPGCGKSVLSRCLIDERHVCPSARASTICYFFFRDGQAERERGANALKAISHQLLKQHPRSNHIKYLLPRFQAHGDKLGGMFSELWNSMLETLSDPTTGEVVWVLDALDECSDFERTRLLDCLTDIYSSKECQNNKNIKLKILITSRQYHDIEVRFRRLEGMAGYIQLDGDEKSEEISQEINLVIEDSVPRVASSLSENDQAKVIEHLKSTPHRTYLWLHLMLKEIEHKVVAHGTERRLASIINKLPRSVYDAYEQILKRSVDPDLARKILQIVIAAVRALTVSEMNVALALALQGRCSSYDTLDRPSDQEFRSSVKQICGLFVSIVDQKVYLLHQTAREFLICQPELASQGWQHSLSLESGHSLIFRICVHLLCLSEFESPPWELRDIMRSFISLVAFRPWIDGHVLLRYAAEALVEHYHQMQQGSDNDLIEAGLELCNTSLKKFVTWWAIYNRSPNYGGNIHVASRIGWRAVVERMLYDGDNVNLRTVDSNSCPLHVAASSDKNYAVVKLLLDRGADVNARGAEMTRPLQIACESDAIQVAKLLLDNGADIDAVGLRGTALSKACGRGNEELVQLLLGRGANVNLGEDGDGFTSFPLVRACRRGYIMIAQDLINHGADIKAIDSLFGTALTAACSNGHEAIARLLLQKGADINAVDLDGTALVAACSEGHEAIARLLLQKGADINAMDLNGTALIAACSEGHEAIARLLIQKGADIEAVSEIGQYNALVGACSGGYESIVRLLLDSGAEASKQSIVQLDICKQAPYKMAVGISPLHGAAWEGSVKVAQLLIDHGADVNTQDDRIGTPLVLAAYRGWNSMVEFLLNKGADVLATGDLFVNALVAAAQGRHRHRHILQLLLSQGARFCKSDWEGLTDWDSEGYLPKLDSIYEQVKDKNMQETIEVLLAEGEMLNSCKAEEISRIMDFF